MGNNPYQSDREARNTLPGFIFLIGIIIASIWAIKEVAVLINDYFMP